MQQQRQHIAQNASNRLDKSLHKKFAPPRPEFYVLGADDQADTALFGQITTDWIDGHCLLIGHGRLARCRICDRDFDSSTMKRCFTTLESGGHSSQPGWLLCPSCDDEIRQGDVPFLDHE